MIEWKIWYANGSSFSNEDGFWGEAPVDGVLFVTVADPDAGRCIFRDTDFYAVPPGGQPYGVDDLGAYLRAYVPEIKHGLCVPREQYEAIYERAWRDPDFPRKTPRRRRDD
jgi:hypothetical protein